MSILCFLYLPSPFLVIFGLQIIKWVCSISVSFISFFWLFLDYVGPPILCFFLLIFERYKIVEPFRIGKQEKKKKLIFRWIKKLFISWVNFFLLSIFLWWWIDYGLISYVTMFDDMNDETIRISQAEATKLYSFHTKLTPIFTATTHKISSNLILKW